MKQYKLKIKEISYKEIFISAESATKAMELGHSFLLNPEYEIVCIESLEKSENELSDVHTEHCCLTCGCKYSNPECTVTTEKKKQNYPHQSLCEWHYP